MDLLCAFCDAELGDDLDRCQACKRGQPVGSGDEASAPATSAGFGAGRTLFVVGVVLWIIGLVVPFVGIIGVVLLLLGALMEMGDLRSRLEALGAS